MTSFFPDAFEDDFRTENLSREDVTVWKKRDIEGEVQLTSRWLFPYRCVPGSHKAVQEKTTWPRMTVELHLSKIFK